MSEPLFYLQIVDGSGRVAHLPGGGALEVELISALTDAILARLQGHERDWDHIAEAVTTDLSMRSVGVFVTQAAVLASVRDAMTRARPPSVARPWTREIEAGIRDVMRALKDRTKGAN